MATSDAQEAAVADYTRDWHRLMAASREADRTGRPLAAIKLRWQAARAHRAAISEKADEQPTGLER